MNTLLTAPVLSPATRGAKPATGSAAMARRQTAVQPRARILYVDDEPQLRTLGKLVLVRAGYDVDTAEDGQAGWEALHGDSHDLLIIDNSMPRLSGLGLVKKIRYAHITLPVIIASGTLNTEELNRNQWLQITATLLKPFTTDQLLETVKEVLRAAGSTRTRAVFIFPC